MRVLTERPRGCGHRKDGGCYLMGETGVMGNLPACVEVDPPIPVDEEIIPFTRGVYLVNFDAVLTEEDQRTWLVDSSAESLRQRDDHAWDIERYGMPLNTRLRVGICSGMDADEAEDRLHDLKLARGVYLADYILAISKAGKGRRVARETAVMQQARIDKNYIALLASCWRLVGYNGKGADTVNKNLKRLMVSIGAVADAIIL